MLVRLDGESKKLDQSFVHSGTNPSLNRSKDQVFKARFSIIRNIANYEIDVTLTNVNRDIYIYERNGRITGDRKSQYNIDKTEMKSRDNNSTNPVVRIHH